jgi:D-amino peptidase
LIPYSAVRLTILLFLCLASAWPQAKKTIFMITDAEGVAGVCRQDQTDPKDSEMRQLLTGEINAAVDGFLSGGADEVVVWDGHDGSQTLSALTIHPKAKLLMGAMGPAMTMERGYAAVAFIGQHGRANSRGGVMAHSYSSLGIQKMLMNGKPVGEIETRTALAGWYGVPVILLSGDQAAAADLRAIVPTAEFAVVKEGLGYYACLSMSAASARDLIREKARSAMQKIPQIRPYKLDGPVTIEVEHSTRSTPSPDAPLAPGSEMVDARTIRYRGKDFMEAWVRSRRF